MFEKMIERLYWKQLEKRASNLVSHAKAELKLLGDCDEPYQKAMNDHLIRMVMVFADEGHTGFSAGYSIAMLKKLLAFEPITPLTGADEEWNDLGYSDDMKFQNKRCGHVFKGADGRAYDSEGRIFEAPDGGHFTGKGSRVYITFPYVPTREYVKVAA